MSFKDVPDRLTESQDVKDDRGSSLYLSVSPKDWQDHSAGLHLAQNTASPQKDERSLSGLSRLMLWRYPLLNENDERLKNHLLDFDERITNQAALNVQAGMSQERKDALRKDSESYLNAIKDRNHDLELYRRFRKNASCVTPEPPEKPASVILYELEVDAEVKKIIQRLKPQL